MTDRLIKILLLLLCLLLFMCVAIFGAYSKGRQNGKSYVYDTIRSELNQENAMALPDRSHYIISTDMAKKRCPEKPMIFKRVPAVHNEPFMLTEADRREILCNIFCNGCHYGHNISGFADNKKVESCGNGGIFAVASSP